jgi:hypothetical protein
LQETGPIDGRARLTMRGNSVAALLATADGDIALAMTGGKISDLTLRLADLDIANALAVMARDKNRAVPITCLVGDFTAQEGVLKPKTLVLDAEHTTATAEGQIDLRSRASICALSRSPAIPAFLRCAARLSSPARSAILTRGFHERDCTWGAAVALGRSRHPGGRAAVRPVRLE